MKGRTASGTPVRGSAPFPYWNHNVRYFPWVLAAVPPGCRLAVDIGSGDGLLLSRLAERSTQVVGIERSAEMVDRSRRQLAGRPGVRVEQGDFLDWAAAAGSVDLVTAVASLHHVDLTAALTRVRELLRPGGVLAVVGLAREEGLVDRAYGVASLLPVSVLNRRHGLHDPGAPTRDATLSWAGTRSVCRRMLPGVRFRRRLAWRYTALWRKPG